MSLRWPRDRHALMRQSLLRVLALSHESRLNAGVLVANLADEHRDTNRWRLQRLARRLAAGTPLVAALEQTPNVLDEREVLAIRFGSQTGTLSAIFERLLAEGSSKSVGRGPIVRSVPYLVLMTFMCLLVLSFLATVIFPSVEEMFDEFGMAGLPLFQAAGRVIPYFSLVAGGLILIAFGVLVLEAFGGWRVLPDAWFPVRLRRRFGAPQMADLLRWFADAIEAGRPLSAALSTLARYHFDPKTRVRLLVARNEIEQGSDVWSGLCEAGLLSPRESAALAASGSPESQAWLMRRLAKQMRERSDAFVDTIGFSLEVAVIFVVAAVVFLVSLVGYERLASEELSNRLGQIVSLPAERRDEAIASLAPSQLLTETLPGAELAASRVTDEQGDRLELVLRWPDRPKGIRIVGWLEVTISEGNGEGEETSR